MAEREALHGAVPQRQHAEFHPGFIWVGLAAAVLGGFGLAGHLSVVIGFGHRVGPEFPTLVQAHGHAQLIGWAGMFVMAASLHFIPRLASVPLRHPRWLGSILWLMGTGLFLRMVGQPALAYLDGQMRHEVLRWFVVASGGLEAAGILLYLFLLLGSVRGAGDLRTQPAFGSVRPFFGMMVGGWLLFAGVNFYTLLDMGLRGRAVVNPAWDSFGIQAFLNLMLLPVALAFSVRLFPMVLALSAAFWPVRRGAYIYLVGAGLQLASPALGLCGLEGRVPDLLAGFGGLIKGGVLLWFTWELDLLTCRRPVERPARFLQIGPDRPPTRPGLPDFGEFGRFELLVCSAYMWLVVAALGEILNSGAILATGAVWVDPSVVRHIYLLGFITLLIFGVSVRMLPGFLKRRAVAFPALVEPTFWLGNTAVLFRVTPWILPPVLQDLLPAVTALGRIAFGLSGIIALGAVCLLAVNLVWTARTLRSATASPGVAP